VTSKVFIVSSEFPPGPGGVGIHAYQLATYLTTLNWTVQVATPQPYSTVDEQHTFNKSVSFPVQTLVSSNSRRLLNICRLAQAMSPDLIVGTGPRAMWAAAFVAKLIRRPYVIVGHGSEYVRKPWLTRSLTRWATASADKVIVVSNYTKQLVAASTGAENVVVIPNGADDSRFCANLDTTALRERLGLKNKQVLLTVGHLSERKAHDVVIRALPQIAQIFPDVVYVMAGLPTLQKQLEQLAASLGVLEHIRAVGSVEDAELPYYYNLCDLFVLLSRQAKNGDVEGFGIVALEAGLCGKMAVVSKGNGLEEAIIDGETGIAIPGDNPEAAAETIIDLLTNDEKRRQMSRAARSHAETMTWKNCVERYDAVMRNVISG
jgi:phosphatidylinositol alpha-1,6-mannosyltransferase